MSETQKLQEEIKQLREEKEYMENIIKSYEDMEEEIEKELSCSHESIEELKLKLKKIINDDSEDKMTKCLIEMGLKLIN